MRGILSIEYEIIKEQNVIVVVLKACQFIRADTVIIQYAIGTDNVINAQFFWNDQ